MWNVLKASVVIFILAVMNLNIFGTDWVWIESEDIELMPPVATAAGWGESGYLSQGKVLSINVSKNELNQKIPESGLLLRYEFNAPTEGNYELWNRLVFENIRSPFEWRIDKGPWIQNSQEKEPVTNVQELSFWNPIGWSRMGSYGLDKGAHVLEIKISRQYKEDRNNNLQPDNLRYISDAICIYKGTWNPNFKHKPDYEPSGEIDKKAGETVFKFEDKASPRSTVVLNGVWQYAPWDEVGEISDEQRVSGVDAIPNGIPLKWYGINVPSDRNGEYPEFLYSHRAIYRTKIDVPAEFKGRSFILNFEALNLMASLFVNGQRVGDFDIVYGQWQPDVTAYIKPGEVNEIAVVMKDAFYALSRDLRRTQYMPMELFTQNSGVTMKFDYPVKGAIRFGLVDEVSLIATGPVYVEDIFVKPYPITRGEIEVDVTLTGNADGEATVTNRVEPWHETAKGIKDLSEIKALVAKGKMVTNTVKASTDGLDLWWTHEPHLYNLITEVSLDGKVVDRKTTRFGVREWEHRGNQFYLNGVRQHLRSDLTHYGASEGEDLDQVVADWKANGMNCFRLRFQFPWAGKTPRQFLEWTDEVGMPVRKNAGTFDGQHASYALALTQGKGQDRIKKPNMPLFNNWHKQMLNRAKARRNHPSVWIWELDNEIVYINARNLGNLDVTEPQFTRTSNALMEMDPTRYTITGGGNALMDESLPTYGPHYFEVNDRYYPDEAYTMERSIARQGTGEGGKVWPMDFDSRPTFMSETAFLPGRAPAAFSQVMGESAFIGRSFIGKGTSLVADWLACGYRWRELGGAHFWFSDTFAESGHIHAWQPVAALVRQWNWTLGEKTRVVRDLKVFNGTRHDDPITVKWQYLVEGKTADEGEKIFNIAAGENAMWKVEFTTPEVDERKAADFVVTATRGGEAVYHHKRPGFVIPERTVAKPEVDQKIVVWDPKGEAVSRLKERGIRHLLVNSMNEIPADFELLIVGRDAINKQQSTDIQWLKWASSSRKILVLEQENPLHYQAVGTDLEPSEYDGRIVFSQNLEHPVFKDIEQADLTCWSGNHAVYKNVYEKSTKGAVSLAHCDDMLKYSALSFLPVNDGAMMLNQMLVGEKMPSDMVAQYLFDNMVNYMAAYEKIEKQTAVVADMDTPIGKMIAEMGLSYKSAADPLEAIQNNENDIVVVQATKERLAKLASDTETVAAFNQRGGWLIILGVTPETLEDYNKIVGYNHLIRPFEMEMVRFPDVRDPLTAGLGQSDVVMSTGQRIDRWRRDEWPAKDAFAWILDIDDIAPFSEYPSPAHWNDPGTKGPGSDTWPRNMVNGFLASTHWRVIFSIHLMNNDPTSWDIKLPREETITKLTIAPNSIYHRITQMRLVFDGNPDSVQTFELDKGSDIIELDVKPTKAKTLTVELTEWDESGRSDVIGIDNLWLTVQRPEGFYEKVKPLLNIGGLIKYPRGEGGILTYQYAVRENESFPPNRIKKQNVIATLLRNLGAVFAGGNTIVPGTSLRYETISLEDYCNLYLSSDQGWPDKQYDLSALPIDEQTFKGVKYLIRDFKTSPLENAVTLKSNRPRTGVDADSVKDIAVNRKADALFFLHTYLQGREWKPDRRNNEPPVLWQYVIHYEDGTSETADVIYNSGVSNWLHEASPVNLRDASVAWTTVVGEQEPMNAVVYQYQWTNPRPDKTIKSVDLQYGPDGSRWGAPVLLGITAGHLIGQ